MDCARDLRRRRDQRLFRRLPGARVVATVFARKDAGPDRRQASRLRGHPGARRQPDHFGPHTMGGDRHPLPGNPGFGLAGVSGGAPGSAAGHRARQMEDHRPIHRAGFSDRWARRRIRPSGIDNNRDCAPLDRSHSNALYWLGLYEGELRPCRERLRQDMKALYFAWVRERVGTAEEELSPPSTVETVGDLIAWLRERGEGYAHAFDKPAAVRAALDRVHARSDASIAGAKEVAFFPPMTGG